MGNEALRHQVTEVMALVEEQLARIAAVREEQTKLTAVAAAADGMVEVTVDVQGRVTKTVIDESYLDDHEFEELGDHITEAAKAAAQEAAERSAVLVAPVSERRQALPALSDFVEGAPDLRALMPPWLDPGAVPLSEMPDDGVTGGSGFPVVRR